MRIARLGALVIWVVLIPRRHRISSTARRRAHSLDPGALQLIRGDNVVIQDMAALVTVMRYVNGQLRAMSAKGLLNTKSTRIFKEKMSELQKDWQVILDVLQNLLWDSRQLAGEASALAADFLQVHLPQLTDQAIPLQTTQAELENYSKNIDVDMKSRRIRDGFVILLERIDGLENILKRIVSEYKEYPEYRHVQSVVCAEAYLRRMSP